MPCCKSSKSRSDRARVGGHEQTRRARQTDEKRRTLGEILAGPLAWDHLLDNRAWPGNLVAYLLPVVGILLGVIVLREQVDARTLLGTVLIIGGVGLVNSRSGVRRLLVRVR